MRLMSPPPAEPPPSRSRPLLCLGDPLVDLLCHHPVAGPEHVTAFVPHLGGVVANVAVIAARAGAATELAGGAGEDEWGHWLRARLEREGVGLGAFRLVSGEPTRLALAIVDAAGDASYTVYGSPAAGFASLPAAELEAAVAQAGGILLGSNTLVAEGERALSMRAREVALEAGLPVLVDVNLRLHRWRSRADAAASANACVPGALLVRANRREAEILTGEEDPERAARALLKAGARAVVVSLGAEGAILRGELRADAPAPAAPGGVLSTLGAGDVLSGVLVARLALSGYYLPAVAAALPAAVAEATAACGRWGALG